MDNLYRCLRVVWRWNVNRPVRVLRHVSNRGQSALIMCAAKLRHIAGSKWGQGRHLNMSLLKDAVSA